MKAIEAIVVIIVVITG